MRLILLPAYKPKRRRRRACSVHYHAEGIVENAIRDCLGAICDASGAAKNIPMIELADYASAFAQAGCVDCRAILEYRTGWASSIGSIVERAGAVYLASSQVQSIVLESVGRASRIGDAGHPVLIVI